jgi:drug/metabolite transporter (DMT)-like permease
VVVLLVLCSALLHALWNAMLKTERDKDVAGAAVVGMAALVAIVAALLLWIVTRTAPFPMPSGLAWTVAAGLFEGMYFVLLVLALERCPLAVGYTVSRGVAILAVWPVSIGLLDEPMTASSLVGSALLCLGLAANAIGKGRGTARGVLFACLCGLAISGYHLCYKEALATGAAPAAVFAVAVGLAWPLSLARLARPRLPVLGRAVRARPGFMLLLGSLTTASFLLFLLALEQSGAGFVLTLRNTSIVFAAFIGWALGERPTRPQLIGAILVTGGAVLVGLTG